MNGKRVPEGRGSTVLILLSSARTLFDAWFRVLSLQIMSLR